MSLPIDRTSKSTLDTNLVNGNTSDAPVIKNSNDVVYNTIDELYNYTSGLVAGGVLQPYPAFLSRQALINGNFDCWQRNTSFNLGTSALYTADRWVAFRSTLVTGMTVSRQDGTGVVGSRYCARVQRNSADTSIASTNIIQAMESADAIKLRGKFLTISFWARAGANFSPISSRILVAPTSGTGTDESPLGTITGLVDMGSNYVNLSPTWTRYTMIVSQIVPANSNQLFFKFVSEPLGTAGTNDYFEIAQVQVNTGNTALPFQPRSFADELILCQRYYEKSYQFSDAPGAAVVSGTFGHQAVTVNPVFTIPFKVRKRIAPTMAFYSSTTGASAKFRDFTASVDIAAATGNNGETQCSVNVTGTVAGNLIIGHWTADAEI